MNNQGPVAMTLPVRRVLPHDVPSWVADGAIFFLTVNCQARGGDTLATPNVATRIRDAFQFRHERGEWFLRLLIIMPDHLHALLSVPPDKSLRRLIEDTKRYLAKSSGIVWQRGFFDHRVRCEENLQEKARYIRENPVRKGLVATSDEWPYTWQHSGGGLPNFDRR